MNRSHTKLNIKENQQLTHLKWDFYNWDKKKKKTALIHLLYKGLTDKEDNHKIPSL